MRPMIIQAYPVEISLLSIALKWFSWTVAVLRRRNNVPGRGTIGREAKFIFQEVSTSVRTNHFPFHDGRCLTGWWTIALGAQYWSLLLRAQSNSGKGNVSSCMKSTPAIKAALFMNPLNKHWAVWLERPADIHWVGHLVHSITRSLVCRECIW